MSYIYTALASAILGMGLPTIVAYIIVAVLAVLAHIQMAAHLIQAHIFVLYFSIFSGLTPSVSLAVLAGVMVPRRITLKPLGVCPIWAAAFGILFCSLSIQR